MYSFKPFTINVYIHICQVNNYLSIFEDLLNSIKISGLYNIINKIYVVILGNDNNYKILKLDEKIECVYNSGETYLYERPILNHILNTIDDNDRVLYLHTKGVRFNGNH